MLSFPSPLVGGAAAFFEVGAREDVGIYDFVLASFAFINGISDTTGEGGGKLFIVRTSDNLLGGISSKNPLRKKPRGTALTVSRGHVNDEDALVRFIELLEGVACRSLGLKVCKIPRSLCGRVPTSLGIALRDTASR